MKKMYIFFFFSLTSSTCLLVSLSTIEICFEIYRNRYVSTLRIIYDNNNNNNIGEVEDKNSSISYRFMSDWNTCRLRVREECTLFEQQGGMCVT